MAKVFHLENLLVFMKQTEKLIQTPDIMVVPEDFFILNALYLFSCYFII